MEKCPYCEAEFREGEVCPECGLDLSSLIKVEKQAEMHRKRAVSAFVFKEFDEMFYHAKRYWSLYRTADSVKLLACAAVLTGRFNLGFSLWSGIKHDTPSY